jgi:predicted nuclease with TOPRIM domain
MIVSTETCRKRQGRKTVPSVKSYQNRKREIEFLKKEIERIQETRSSLERNHEELYKQVQIARSQADLFGRRLNTSEELRTSLSKIIDALSQKVTELEQQVRIYRHYIRTDKWTGPQYTVTIPSFMKPFDSIEFVQKVNEVVSKL